MYSHTVSHVKTEAPPPRLTRAERQARTRADLLGAAARVFVQRGFQGSSVEAIAAEAGYSRGAFYSNFASKEELFAELLQERVYDIYGRMAQTGAAPTRPNMRELGARLAAIQRHPEGRWLFVLWLEVLAHAGRDERFRAIAARFWSDNRERGAKTIEAAYATMGQPPPVPGRHLATAMIALDIGLALQHFVDPDAAPLEVYPDLYDALFSPLEPPRPSE